MTVIVLYTTIHNLKKTFSHRVTKFRWDKKIILNQKELYDNWFILDSREFMLAHTLDTMFVCFKKICAGWIRDDSIVFIYISVMHSLVQSNPREQHTIKRNVDFTVLLRCFNNGPRKPDWNRKKQYQGHISNAREQHLKIKKLREITKTYHNKMESTASYNQPIPP